MHALGRGAQALAPAAGEGVGLEACHDVVGQPAGIRLAEHGRLHQPDGGGVVGAGAAHAGVGERTGLVGVAVAVSRGRSRVEVDGHPSTVPSRRADAGRGPQRSTASGSTVVTGLSRTPEPGWLGGRLRRPPTTRRTTDGDHSHRFRPLGGLAHGGRRPGVPRVQRGRHVRRVLAVARRGGQRQDQPRGAHRRGALDLLLDGALARPGPGRAPRRRRSTPPPRSPSSPARASPASCSRCSARCPGITAAQFEEAAQAAKTGCPVSQALAAVPISLEVSFAGEDQA